MKSAILLLFLTLGLNSQGQESGIRFSNDSLLSIVLKKAKIENKLVFVDCYATWCRPCRDMDLETFPDAEVGKFFNKNFICVKFDMEKPEGLKIRKKYNVTAYPTYLFLNIKGEQVYYSVGFNKPFIFINIAKIALNKHLNIMTNSVIKGTR
jgi:thiol:disulfide interchange protein